ncbi:MAG: hypothetical protein GXX96_04985 [Planctomycetaceae bacterium]|nr:hypothetical protein [Planctomycetaceae bacterium]
MTEIRRSEKHEAARSSLPEELRPIFDQFVDDYKFAGTVYHGSPFVSYIILAEMVKAGWRLTGEPMGQWAKPPKESPAESNADE